jgi:hypothetical protein
VIDVQQKDSARSREESFCDPAGKTGVFESLAGSSSSSTPVAALVTDAGVVDFCRICSGGGCSGRGRHFSGSRGGGSCGGGL